MNEELFRYKFSFARHATEWRGPFKSKLLAAQAAFREATESSEFYLNDIHSIVFGKYPQVV